MVRTQIQLEERQHQQIRRLAQRKQISMSEAIRRLLREGLSTGIDGASPPRAAALLEIAGVGASGLGDLGEKHDDYVAEDYES